MPVNTYITANGRIRRRITTNGGAVTDQVAVVTNALGSVVATYKDGWLTADRSYDPYGETRAEWNDVGRFGWVGGLGYRETRREWVSHYVRARHYGFPMGMWTSVDPLWPSELAFGYVGGRTVTSTDRSGESPTATTTVTTRVDDAIVKQINAIARTQGRNAAIRFGLAKGLTLAAIMAILYAGYDLINYACTGRTGLLTGPGDRLGKDIYDNGEQFSLPFYVPSKVPTPKNRNYPRNCKEANELMHRLCDGQGKVTYGPVASGWRGNDDAERCFEIRRRMSIVRDCIQARYLQERICGRKGPGGTIDESHQGAIDKKKDLHRKLIDLFAILNCSRFL